MGGRESGSLSIDPHRGVEQFVPESAVEQFRAGQGRMVAEQRVTATILFTDLRDSTTLAERLTAESVVDLLNAYLSVMLRSVLHHGGVLDRFLGDGFMAVFGLPDESQDGANAAVEAMLAMRAAVEAINRTGKSGLGSPVSFGVGIHTGLVIVGPIGLPERFEFTVLGDTVNTAARLSGLCRDFHVDVVMSGETAARLSGDRTLRPLGSVQLRGKSEPMNAFTLP